MVTIYDLLKTIESPLTLPNGRCAIFITLVAVISFCPMYYNCCIWAHCGQECLVIHLNILSRYMMIDVRHGHYSQVASSFTAFKRSVKGSSGTTSVSPSFLDRLCSTFLLQILSIKLYLLERICIFFHFLLFLQKVFISVTETFFFSFCYLPQNFNLLSLFSFFLSFFSLPFFLHVPSLLIVLGDTICQDIYQ